MNATGASITINDTEFRNFNRVGGHGGIFAKINLPGKFLFMPEILFSNEGAGIPELPDAIPPGPGELHLNYVNLPMMLNYNLNRYLAIQLGPELSYLISGRSIFDEERFDLGIIYRDWELGLAGGLLFSFNDKLDLGFRYLQGITSSIIPGFVTDANGMLTDERFTTYNRGFQFSFYYTIN